MKNRIIIFNLLAFVAIGNVFALPTITSANSTGTTIKFTAKLSEKLPSGYKVKIDYSNGKGSIPMICSSTSCTLSSNTLPTVNAASYKIGIYDAKGNLQNSTIGGDYVISTASIGYSKILPGKISYLFKKSKP